MYNNINNIHLGGHILANKAILKKTEVKYMMRMPQSEVTEAMKELSNGAYRLLTYYYSRRDGWTFIDENIAKAIDSTVRQVKKYRKELIDTQYLLIQKGSLDVYFVGKLTVYKYLNDIVEVDDEPMEPIITSGKK